MKKIMVINGIPTIKGRGIPLKGYSMRYASVVLDDGGMPLLSKDQREIWEKVAAAPGDPAMELLTSNRASITSCPLSLTAGVINAYGEGNTMYPTFEQAYQMACDVQRVGENTLPRIPRVFVEDPDSSEYIYVGDEMILVSPVRVPIGFINWGRFLKALAPDADETKLNERYQECIDEMDGEKRYFMAYFSIADDNEIAPVEGAVTDKVLHWTESVCPKADAFEDIVCSWLGVAQFMSLGPTIGITPPKVGGRVPLSKEAKERIQKHKKSKSTANV